MKPKKTETPAVAPQFPTATEIASIAATIANGRAAHGLLSHDAAVKEALALWTEAQQQVSFMVKADALRRANDQNMDAALSEARERFKSLTFPVSLDEFLRLAMPKSRPADRYEKFRAYLRQLPTSAVTKNSPVNSPPEGRKPAQKPKESAKDATPSLIDLSAYEGNGFDEFGFHIRFERFTAWLEKERSESARERAGLRWPDKTKPIDGTA